MYFCSTISCSCSSHVKINIYKIHLSFDSLQMHTSVNFVPYQTLVKDAPNWDTIIIRTSELKISQLCVWEEWNINIYLKRSKWFAEGQNYIYTIWTSFLTAEKNFKDHRWKRIVCFSGSVCEKGQAQNIWQMSLHNLKPCHSNTNVILDFVMFFHNFLKSCGYDLDFDSWH